MFRVVGCMSPRFIFKLIVKKVCIFSPSATENKDDLDANMTIFSALLVTLELYWKVVLYVNFCCQFCIGLLWWAQAAKCMWLAGMESLILTITFIIIWSVQANTYLYVCFQNWYKRKTYLSQTWEYNIFSEYWILTIIITIIDAHWLINVWLLIPWDVQVK